MIDVIKSILTNVLIALYQPFWAALLMAILLIQTYLTAKEKGSLKNVILQWKNSFIADKKFRWLFLFFFYLVMILFRTLLNRNMWANPVANVIGTWGIYNSKGELTTEAIENLMLFVPFTFLLMVNFRDKVLHGQRLHSSSGVQ